VTEWAGRRYWIVGASEGLGRALAEQLSRFGARLVLSARGEDRLHDLARALPGHADVVPVDVSDRDSVRDAAAAAGEIDGLVYLAGVWWSHSAREWDADKVEKMLDINLMGAARVLGHVVPPMVARDRGHVVLTGSLAAYRGLPRTIGYSASKAGIASLAESMRADLAGTGVKVQLVNPGFIKTRMTDKNDFPMPQLMSAQDAAAEMAEHMSTDAFRRNFPAGLATAVRFGQLLPDWAYTRIFPRK